MLLGKQKKANANAMRNNNAKKQGKVNGGAMDAEFASYAEVEAEKMSQDYFGKHQNK